MRATVAASATIVLRDAVLKVLLRWALEMRIREGLSPFFTRRGERRNSVILASVKSFIVFPTCAAFATTLFLDFSQEQAHGSRHADSTMGPLRRQKQLPSLVQDGAPVQQHQQLRDDPDLKLKITLPVISHRGHECNMLHDDGI